MPPLRLARAGLVLPPRFFGLTARGADVALDLLKQLAHASRPARQLGGPFGLVAQRSSRSLATPPAWRRPTRRALARSLAEPSTSLAMRVRS